MNENSLQGRTALVTGAGSGIGRAIARTLAARGASLTVADLDEAAADAVATEIGGTAWAVDLADTSALERMTLDADVLVNNAGIQRVHPIEEFPLEEWRLITTLMLESPFVLTKSVLPGMYERGWGRIINISSVHGLRASAFKSAYVAAKHGLMGLTKVTALEGGPRGVTCNAINPGYVDTPLLVKQVEAQAATHGIAPEEVMDEVFLAHSAVPRLPSVEDVAELAAFLTTDAAATINGAAHSMDGGWSAA